MKKGRSLAFSFFLLTVLGFQSHFAIAQWVDLHANTPGDTPFSSIVTSGNIILAGGYGGVLRSSDNGATWTASTTGLPLYGIYCMVLKGTQVFAGTYSGVFVSNDFGATWVASNAGITTQAIQIIVTNGIRLFAVAQPGVFASDDNGISWIALNMAAFKPITAMATDGNNIYAVGDPSFIYYSPDNGNTWTQRSQLDFTTSLAFMNGVLYAGAYQGLYKSVDQGSTWARIGGSLIKNDVVHLVARNGALYGTTDSDFFGVADNTFIYAGSSLALLGNGFPGTASYGLLPAASDSYFLVAAHPPSQGTIGSIYASTLHNLRVDALSSTSGIVGSTVVVTGAGFSSVINQNVVTVNGYYAAILSASPTSLTIRIPNSSGTGQVVVKVNGSLVTYTDPFTITPQITNIIPDHGYVNSEVQILGTGFDPGAITYANFNTTSVNSFNNTNVALTTIVPQTATTGPVTVLQNGRTITSPVNFTVLPLITGFSPVSAAPGAQVQVLGTGFSGDASNVEVRINGVVSPVVQARFAFVVITVPSTATSGAITLSDHGLVTSALAPFIVLPLKTICLETPAKPTITAGSYPYLISSSSSNYQWFLNGSPIPDAIDSVYSAHESGIYTVEVLELGCPSLPSDGVNFVVTGLDNEIGSRPVSVYPNPVTNEMVIDLSSVPRQSGLVNIEVFDLMGRSLFKSQEAGGGAVHFDASVFKSGIYLLKLSGATHPHTIKVIKR